MPFCAGVSAKGVCSIGALYQEKPLFATHVPPQPLKLCRIGRRVHDGVLNIPVPQIVLNELCVCALIGQGKAARVAQHVWVRFEGQDCKSAIVTDHQPCRLTAQRAAPFADKESVHLRLHPYTVG